MEMTSRIIRGGPNGVSIDSEEQANYIGKSAQNHTNAISNESYRAPARDVSFSSYLGGGIGEQISNTPLIVNAADSQSKGETSIDGGDTSKHVFFKGLDKQQSSSRRVQALGRVTKDSEISIFEAQRYFSYQEQKKTDEPITESSQPTQNSKFASKNKAVLFSGDDLYHSSNPISSPASSIVVVNSSFRAGVATPTSSSEASWSSQSGLLSRTAARISAIKSPAIDGIRDSRKCAFGCKWPCSDRKSLKIDDTLTDFKRAQSVSNSLNSTARMHGPQRSIRYSYPHLGKRALGRFMEKQRSEAFADNESVTSDLNSSTNGGPGLKTLIDHLATAVDRDVQIKVHRNNGKYNRDPDEEHLEQRRDQRRITGSSVETDGFSFPILHVKSQEKTRPPLEVFGSPFPGTPICEETGDSSSGTATPHLMQPSDLHKRLVLFTIDKARNSFTFDSNSEILSFGGNLNTPRVEINGDEDKQSDSSSDLFEIESFATQGTASHSLTMRDCLEDIQPGYPATNCELGFRKSLHFGGMEEAQSICYEPGEASLDWSMTTGDTLDKASLGNFCTDYEETKKHASLQGLDFAGPRDASTNGSSKRRTSTGSFLGCAGEKSVSVVSPTGYSQGTRYNYGQRELRTAEGKSLRRE